MTKSDSPEVTRAPPPRTKPEIASTLSESTQEREARRKAFNATISRAGGPSDPDAEVEGNSVPAGGGSTPDPNDPATVDPLGHLDDLPGVSEEPPSPGEGDIPTDEIPPAPEPPPPEAPPPASRKV
jgi:hypothetical protein